MALVTPSRGSAVRAVAVSIVAFFLLAPVTPAGSAPAVSIEAPLKVAFLFNFAKFVDWPSDAPASRDGTFVIGLLRESPILEALKSIDGRELHGRRLVVRRFARAEDAVCHVLFVDGAQTASFAQEAEKLKGQPVLTVGEGDRFLEAGGMIALIEVDGHIRFRVRTRQAQIARLTISSKLLKLADRTVD